MKGKLFIILLLFCLKGSSQSIPNTDNFCWSDVWAITGGNCHSQAFANSVDAFFDPLYKGSKDRLGNFRNYHAVTIYWNTVVSCSVTKNNCEGGYHGVETYTGYVYANSVSSIYSVYDANIIAQAQCESDMQIFANTNGSCAPDCTRPGGLSTFEFVWDNDPSWHPEGQMYGNNGDYAYSGIGGTDCSTFPDGFYHVGGNAGYISDYHWYWDITPCTTRPTGLSSLSMWYVMGGVSVTSANVCTVRAYSTSTGLSAQSTLGEGADVYFNENSTNCDKITDGYYVLQVGWGTKYAVQVTGGTLHYLSCGVAVY